METRDNFEGGREEPLRNRLEGFVETGAYSGETRVRTHGVVRVA